ncbi:hypothetical protein R1sor_017032 [Riccia sorocarpa]|uniref:AP2/ERF domain-containing protein n=1 Tax=Riccia sorocarpa TaxID=122646 RepID=A0ABD3I980_9MARC
MANDRRQAKLGLTRQPSGSIPRPPPVGGGGASIARQLSGDVAAAAAATSTRKRSAAAAAASDSTSSDSKETGGTMTGSTAANATTVAPTTPKPSGRQRRGGPENGNHTFRGVRQRQWGRWVAEIREPRCRTRMWLGTFATAIEAARAYDDAALTYHGPGARLNLPESRPKGLNSTATSPVQPSTPRVHNPHPMSGLARSASCSVANYIGQDSFGDTVETAPAAAVSSSFPQQNNHRPAHPLLRTSSSPAQCTLGAAASDFDSSLFSSFTSDMKIEERAAKKMFLGSNTQQQQQQQQHQQNSNTVLNGVYPQAMSSAEIPVSEAQTPAVFMNVGVNTNNCSSATNDVIHENPFADMFGGDLGAVVSQQASTSNRPPKVDVTNRKAMVVAEAASSSSSVSTAGAGVLGNCGGDEGSPTSFWTIESQSDPSKFDNCAVSIADWLQVVDQQNQQEQVATTSSCSGASSSMLSSSTTTTSNRLGSVGSMEKAELGPWDIGLCSPPPALDLPLGMEEPLVQFDEDFLSGQLFQDRGMNYELL